MLKRGSILRSLGAPLSVGLVAAAGVAWYALVWVPAQQRYFTSHNLRLLARLGTGLQSSIDNLDNVLDNAASIAKSDRKTYFQIQVPDLVEVNLQEAHRGNDRPALFKAGDPPSLIIEADEGTFFLLFGFQSNESGKSTNPEMWVRIKIDTLIAPLQITQEFDTILVARARTGQVIFQSSRASGETRLTQLNSLITIVNGTPKPIALDTLSTASQVSDVSLAGDDYKLFTQPLQLSYPSVDLKAGGRGDPETWILAGLVGNRRFSSTSHAISLTYIVWFTMALVLLLFSHPFVKTFTAGRTTRLRSYDPVFVTISLFVSSALITLALLDAYHDVWSDSLSPQDVHQHALTGPRENVRERGVTDPEKDGRLGRFAERVKKHFRQEQQQIWNQLDAFTRDSEWAIARQVVEEGREFDKGACHPPTCRVKMSNAGGDYPFLQLVTWSDEQGSQRVKWTVRDVVTPFLDLEESKLPYYQEAKTAWQWRQHNRIEPVDRGVSTLRSPTTGETVTVFWKVLEPADATNPQSHQLMLASLVTKPLSLVQPLIGGDLQYAVNNREGRVLFHADQTKNLSEDFFSECDQDSQLLSLVATGSTGSLTANYLGRRHQLYVTPLDVPHTSVDWFLVAFRSLDQQETMSTGILTLASIVFVLYAGFIGLLWLCTRLWPGYPSKWLWPVVSKAPAYVQVVVVNLVLIAVLVVWIGTAHSAALLGGAVAIPMIALSVALNRLGPIEPPPSGPIWFDWRQGHLLSIASLLVVTAILPALAFFKLSYDFEAQLVVRRDQVKLADQLRARNFHFEKEYARTTDRAIMSDRLRLELVQNDGVYWKHGEAFFEEIPKSSNETTPPPTRGETLVELLAWAHPPYNGMASETRALTKPAAWSQFEVSSTPMGVQERYLVPGQTVLIRSVWVPWNLPRDPRWWAGFVAWMAVVYLVVRLTSRKIFLIDVGAERGDPAPLAFGAAEHVLIIGPPLSGKTAHVRGLLPNVQTFDLRNLTRRKPRASSPNAGPPGVGYKATTESPAAGAGTPQTTESFVDTIDFRQLPDDPTVPIALDHFEHRIAEPSWMCQRLELLEQLAFRYKRKILVVSSVDPLDCIKVSEAKGDDVTDTKPLPSPLEVRWVALLNSFQRRNYPVPPDKTFDGIVRQFEEKLGHVPPRQKERLVATFRKECSRLPRLREIGAEIVDGFTSEAGLGEDQLVDEVLTRADSYYRALWTSCSRDEKLALVQLADEGLVNPANHSAIRQLMAKGLAVRDPFLRVVTTSFSRFVRAEVSPAMVAKWEARDPALHWDSVLLMTVLGASVFLFVTQQEVAKAWMAYLTGAGAAIPALLKMLGGLRSRASESSAS
jgi:hypothetical protein